MKENHPPVPDGHDSAPQRLVGILAAQIDDQMDRLPKDVEGLTVGHLE